MKRIVLFLIAILTMSTIDAKTLTERQQGLAACACLMAQGDMERLEPAVRVALDNGVTINELKEAFSQLYAYTGFPRSLNALGVLSKVLENKQPNWQEGKPWKRPSEWDDAKKAYELGTKNQTQLSGKPFNYEFCPQDDYYLKSHLFGDIFAGDQLSAADREIVTVAALSGLEGVAPQLAAHKQGAVNMALQRGLHPEHPMAQRRAQSLRQVFHRTELSGRRWRRCHALGAKRRFFECNESEERYVRTPLP